MERAETRPISLANDDTLRVSNEDAWIKQMVEWISKTGAQRPFFTRGRERAFEDLRVMEAITR